MHGEVIGGGHVHGNERHLLFHQRCDEDDIACEPVQLGDDERRALATAKPKRFC
jgi:hypothetical protein